MNFPRLVGVIANTTEYERRYCTQSALGSLAFLRTLNDQTLLFVARAEPYGDRYDHHFETVYGLLSPNRSMNPSWLTSTAAGIAYDRGLLFEEELDRLMA